MNLEELMKREVSELKLTDELEIAYYLYMRTGQIFYYNASFMFSSLEEKEKYTYEKPNIKNIKKLFLICYELSDIMVDLLHSFGISAEKKEIKKGNCKHAFVLLYPKNEKQAYKLDLTVNYEDISLLKLGLKVNHFSKVLSGEIFFKPVESKIDKIEEDFYKRGIKKKDFLVKVHEKKRTLMALKKVMIMRMGGGSVTEQEFTYQVYRAIGNLLSELTIDLGYISGAKFIAYLFKYFIGKDESTNITYFYNQDKSECLEIHSMIHEGKPSYFCYHKINNEKFEFREVPQIYVEQLKKIYTSQYIEKLLMPKPDYYEDMGLAENGTLSV